MINKKKTCFFAIFFTLTVTLLFIYSNKNENIEFEINKYTCNNCKMLISNKKFRYQLINKHKKSFKFDDINCMILWANNNNILDIENMWGVDYFNDKWINLKNSFIISEKNIKTPMNSNIIVFKEEFNLTYFKEKKILNLNDFLITRNK